jgi:hypothetical protein
MSKQQYRLDNIEYFNSPNELVPIGDLLGDKRLNCSREEFKNILIEVLENYAEAFKILEAT